jgi:cellulose synthase/poly-beta-1,6-N-acetylglucosamine synthase-like glycosyltransferase
MAYRVGAGARFDRPPGGDWDVPGPAPSIIPTLPANCADATPASDRFRLPHIPRCPEIDCLHGLVAPETMALAEFEAAETGVGADRVLIAWGKISEERYVSRLAASLHIPYEPLIDLDRDRCPLEDDRLHEAARTGMLPLADGDGVKFVVAPRLVDSRRLVELARSGSDLAERIRLTSTQRLHNFVAALGSESIGRRAAESLPEHFPEYSARIRRPRLLMTTALCLAALVIAATAISPDSSRIAEILFGALFMAWTGLRLFGLLSGRPLRLRRRSISDRELPIYTIIVALYHEAAAVKALVAALRNIDYPTAKLDIKLVLEPDDHETLEAIARLELGPPFEIVIAPRGGPRTKPKALNAALPYSRGEYLAVYDAEDRPEPDQLRLALDAFAAGDERLACVQARLSIDNAADNWLTRLFAAEYAGLFDVFLPGLARWRLPLPLGGSSNHFRTAVLSRMGAWDAYNVTEDADLGMRLARFDYRTAIISSTTYEEAPAHFALWLRQRTRWFKGWMQTWLVHMRSPRRLLRELGWAGFAVFQLVVGGTVVAAFVHVLFVAQFAVNLATAAPDDAPARALLMLYGTLLLSGYSISAMLGLVGLARRKMLRGAWALLLTPVYWLLLSVAAWRALFQLLRHPYRWEKTEHGLARTSRFAARYQR